MASTGHSTKPQLDTKTPRPTPHAPRDGRWGWNDGWFSEAGLLAATEDECESTEAEKGGGGGLGDCFYYGNT